MIWLIGNKGMLGTELSCLFEELSLPFIGTDRELDILDSSALERFFMDKEITFIVNCAAYTAVDKAEDEETLAFRLNAEGPENIAALAVKFGTRFLHISTDYVFNGLATQPYVESDCVAPTGAYGRTKAEGERRILAIAPRSIIVRTAWLYGKHGPNFVHTMLRLMKERESIGVVADQYGSPTWARDLAKVIAYIAKNPNGYSGIYHYTNAGETSWYQFAVEIFKLGREAGLLDKDCIVNALSTSQYPTKAKRPAYSVLSKEKILQTGIEVPEWKDSLRTFIKSLG